MAAKPVGGRGKSAPYDTKLMRVPVPLEGQIKELIERYYQWIDDRTFGASNPPNLLDKAVNKLSEVEVDSNDELVNSLRTELEKARSQSKHYESLWEDLAAQKVNWYADLKRESELERDRDALKLEVAELRERLKLVDSLSETEVEDETKFVNKFVEATVETEHKVVDKLPEVQVEDETKPVYKLLETEVEDASKVVDRLLDGLSVRGLAKRLSLGHAVVQQYKTKDSFAEWSKSHDPDGISWRYDTESKRSYPIRETGTTVEVES